MITRATVLIFSLALAVPAVSADDPTRPPSPAEIRAWFEGDRVADDPRSPWKLQSVLIAENRRVAVINDRRVKIGDHVADAEVIEIEPGRVVLRHDDREVSLNIDNRMQSVRQPSND
ncbi:MAG: hypothetical protein ACOCSR_05790 [Wenzhouxiangella sp.]